MLHSSGNGCRCGKNDASVCIRASCFHRHPVNISIPQMSTIRKINFTECEGSHRTHIHEYPFFKKGKTTNTSQGKREQRREGGENTANAPTWEGKERKRRSGSRWVIRTAALHTLPCVHVRPIKHIVYVRPSLPRGKGNTRLGGGFALRCIQRFSILDVAIHLWPGQAKWLTSGPAVLVLSYWERRPSIFQRPWRIETELSRDVLNPARVPFSWANSPTLGTDSSSRIRRADIEVPNLAVAVNAWAR